MKKIYILVIVLLLVISAGAIVILTGGIDYYNCLFDGEYDKRVCKLISGGHSDYEYAIRECENGILSTQPIGVMDSGTSYVLSDGSSKGCNIFNKPNDEECKRLRDLAGKCELIYPDSL